MNMNMNHIDLGSHRDHVNKNYIDHVNKNYILLEYLYYYILLKYVYHYILLNYLYHNDHYDSNDDYKDLGMDILIVLKFLQKENYKSGDSESFIIVAPK